MNETVTQEARTTAAGGQQEPRTFTQEEVNSIVADRLRTAQVEQDAQPQDQAHQQGREQKIAGCLCGTKHTFLRNTSMNLAKSGCQGIVNKVY